MRTAVFLAVVLLTGCVSKPVPVAYDCPQIVLPPDPILATRKLTAKSKPGDAAKAWVSTAVACCAWNKTVRKQVNDSQ
jgi:hypothetical protein